VTQKENAIFYIEFPARDLPATKAFYGKVFGWTFTDYGPDYASFEDGNLAGGFTRSTPGPGTAPLVVLFNKDLEAARERVAQGGGRIVQDIFSFPGGRRFHFADPSGNVLAVCTDVE
jgi:uncharacterized protein